MYVHCDMIPLQESVYESTADHKGSGERWQEPKPGIVRDDNMLGNGKSYMLWKYQA